MAWSDYLQLKEQGEPEEAEQGQGEINISDLQDLVQNQLSELARQVEYVIKAYQEEKHLLEDEFDSVKNGITILKTRLCTK